jgi:hypothetical protein
VREKVLVETQKMGYLTATRYVFEEIAFLGNFIFFYPIQNAVIQGCRIARLLGKKPNMRIDRIPIVLLYEALPRREGRQQGHRASVGYVPKKAIKLIGLLCVHRNKYLDKDVE